MTKLEEEIIKAINGPYWPLEGESLEIAVREAQAAAEVAKKYIMLAVNDAFCTDEKYVDIFLNQWLKENGIIE